LGVLDVIHEEIKQIRQSNTSEDLCCPWEDEE